METLKEKCSKVQQQNSQAALPLKSSSVSEDHLLKVFIQMYRNLPILWDTSLKDYKNKYKRVDAYKQLLLTYKHMKRNATLSQVKKKVSTLRTTYRRMLKSNCTSPKCGTEYQPEWIFYELDFLRSAENCLSVNTSKKKGKKSISSSNEVCTQSEDARQFLDNAPNVYLGNRGNDSSNNATEILQESLCNQSNNSDQMMRAEGTDDSTPPLSMPESLQTNVESSNRKQSEASVTVNTDMNTNFPSPRDEVLNVECKYVLSIYPEEESTARSWACKLKRLPKEQRLLAEKYIKDILFEAESGSLYRGCMELHSVQPFVRLGQSQGKYISQDTAQRTNAISPATKRTTPVESDNLNEVSCSSPMEIKDIVVESTYITQSKST